MPRDADHTAVIPVIDMIAVDFENSSPITVSTGSRSTPGRSERTIATASACDIGTINFSNARNSIINGIDAVMI